MGIPILRTVRQLAERHPALTEGGIRWDIFNENDNGLAKTGAIIRHGRKVLIDEAAYFTWLTGKDCSGKSQPPTVTPPNLKEKIAAKLGITLREAQARIDDAKAVIELANVEG